MYLNFNIKDLIRTGMIILMFTICSNIYAQEQVLLEGEVKADNSNIEKIHIINMNLEKGVVTDAEGKFRIFARQNDSLYVSSVQFQNKTVVVTEEMIRSMTIVINLQDRVNELAEVMIDDIKLSGHLSIDLGKISVTEVETKNMLQNNLNTFIKKDREMNPYVKPVANGGVRIDMIAGAVIDRISKNSEKPVKYSSQELANKSINIVGNEFFRETLQLNENEICNFVYFCTEDSRFSRLVLNNNALVLIEYFENKIDDFKKHRGDALNKKHQIPG